METGGSGSGSGSGVKYSSDTVVIKSPNDRRLYRVVQLHNGLVALLVHDPQIYPDGLPQPEAEEEGDSQNEDDDDDDEDQDDSQEEEEDDDDEDDADNEKQIEENTSQTKKVCLFSLFMLMK